MARLGIIFGNNLDSKFSIHTHKETTFEEFFSSPFVPVFRKLKIHHISFIALDLTEKHR